MPTLLEHPNIQAMVSRMSVADYQKLGSLGLLSEKIELIQGVIFNKMPKSPKHAYVIDFLTNCFREIFRTRFLIRSEQPITTKTSEPEPDISIIEGNLTSFKTVHPSSARLIVEVSLTTYDLDFQKQFVYAEALVNEYWIINLKDKEVEVYKNPSSGKYLEKRIYSAKDFIEIEGTKIELEEIFS